MKITLQLKRGDRNKAGFVPIQLTVSWEGQRIRTTTGCLVLPEHWDEKLQLVQVRPGTQHSSINPRLNVARTAAGQDQETVPRQSRRRLDGDEADGPTDFAGLFQQWLPIHSWRALFMSLFPSPFEHAFA